MRGVYFIAAMLSSLPAVYGESALEAVKQLPAGQAARIVKIEAREGTPDPDRWYILTHDPAADNGVHEFVVSHGAVVASRAVSQFAESLKPQEMMGAAPVKIDSDKAGKLARDYAAANGTVVSAIDYELKKDGVEGAPAWRVWCMDDKGNKLGEVVVAANDGTVLSHEGFVLEPAPAATPDPSPVAVDPPSEESAPPPHRVAAAAPATSPSVDPRHPAKPAANPVAKAFQGVGRTLEKLNPF